MVHMAQVGSESDSWAGRKPPRLAQTKSRQVEKSSIGPDIDQYLSIDLLSVAVQIRQLSGNGRDAGLGSKSFQCVGLLPAKQSAGSKDRFADVFRRMEIVRKSSPEE